MVVFLEEFRNFLFLDNDNIIVNLVSEFFDYFVVVDGVVMEDEEEKFVWWVVNSVRFLYWVSLVKKLLFI